MRGKQDILVVETAAALADRAAHLFREIVEAAVAARGRSAVALAGGSTPRKMHVLLGQDPISSAIPWDKVHLFWGDERCVPVESPWSNFGCARKDLLDHINIPMENLHPMPGTLPPEEGASRYEKEVPEVFDLVFLGLGIDGHTASLFPGHPSTAAQEGKRKVIPVRGGAPFAARLTLTFAVLNRARNVVFLVSGKKKAGVAKSVLEDRDKGLPAAQVHPVSGNMVWILDRDAASLLPQELLNGTSPR